MSGKKRSVTPSTPRSRALPFIQEFFQLCPSGMSLGEWQLEPFLIKLKTLKMDEFNQILSYIKEYSKQYESDDSDYSYVADYSALSQQFDNVVHAGISKLKDEKPSTIRNNSQSVAILRENIANSSYRVNIWVAVLTKVLSRIELSQNQKRKKQQEILDELFFHLPGFCEITIRNFMALEDGPDEYETVCEVLPYLLDHTAAFVNGASPDVLVDYSTRLLTALSKAREFELVMQEGEHAAKFAELFEVTYRKVEACLNPNKHAELKQTLALISDDQAQIQTKIDNNPWLSLFTFYQKDWVDETKIEEPVNIENERLELTILLQDESLVGQSELIARLKKVLRHFNTVSDNNLAPEEIAKYAEVIQLVYDHCIDKEQPKETSIKCGVLALLLSMQSDIEEYSPITKKLDECLHLMQGVPLALNEAFSIDEFNSRCKVLVEAYQQYANTHPYQLQTSEHLQLTIRFEQLIRYYKSLPAEQLEASTKALYNALLSILKHNNQPGYQVIANELKDLLFSLLKLKRLAPTVPVETAPIVECVAVAEPEPEPEPEPDSGSDSEPESELEPVQEREHDPESTTVFAPLNESVNDVLREEASKTVDIAPFAHEMLSTTQAEIDAQVLAVAQEFEQIRIAQKVEQEQAVQARLQVDIQQLEERLSRLSLSHQKKLDAQRATHEKALEQQRNMLAAQYEKKLAQANRQYAKAVAKQEQEYKAELAGLPVRVKQESQARIAQVRKMQDEDLKLQQEKYRAELVLERQKMESENDYQEMATQHEAKLNNLHAKYKIAKDQLPELVKARSARGYQQALDAQRARYVEELVRYRSQIELDLTKQFQAEAIAMYNEAQAAKQAIAARANDRLQLLDNVHLPLSLILFFNKFRANPESPIPLNGYYNTLSSLIIGPDYLKHFNQIYNLGLLPTLIPTLPERYSLLLSKYYPDLLSLWRSELAKLNSQPEHGAKICAIFLLLPLIDNVQHDPEEQRIQYCIERFVACFSSDNPADKIAMTKALESALPELYNDYCKYANLHAEKASRGYHPQYGQVHIARRLRPSIPDEVNSRTKAKSKIN